MRTLVKHVEVYVANHASHSGNIGLSHQQGNLRGCMPSESCPHHQSRYRCCAHAKRKPVLFLRMVNLLLAPQDDHSADRGGAHMGRSPLRRSVLTQWK